MSMTSSSSSSSAFNGLAATLGPTDVAKRAMTTVHVRLLIVKGVSIGDNPS